MTQILGYKRQLVAYIDLLGFSEATSSQEDKTTILSLLKSLASARSDFNIHVVEQTSNLITTNTTPCVSTFSDNMIISYELEKEDVAEINFHMSSLKRRLFMVALISLPMGFMIRGGITIGLLYHSQSESVVFGEALVEAHKLESAIAIYPRIVLSKAVSNLIPDYLDEQKQPIDLLGFKVKDFDGMYYLNYFKYEILEHFYPENPPASWKEDLSLWINNVQTIIQKNIDKYSQTESLAILAKWEWFSLYFKSVISSKNKDARPGFQSIQEVMGIIE